MRCDFSHPTLFHYPLFPASRHLTPGGENASSLAIESALFQHPDVLEVAVVARPHDKYGERAMAFVILRPDSKASWKGKFEEFEKALKDHAKKLLPGFARPEWVEVVEELPKTSTGKIQKHGECFSAAGLSWTVWLWSCIDVFRRRLIDSTTTVHESRKQRALTDAYCFIAKTYRASQTLQVERDGHCQRPTLVFCHDGNERKKGPGKVYQLRVYQPACGCTDTQDQLSCRSVYLEFGIALGRLLAWVRTKTGVMDRRRSDTVDL